MELILSNTSLTNSTLNDPKFEIIAREGVRIGIIVALVISAWIVLSNILFLIVLFANKHLRKPSSMFLLNLCLSDLCVGGFIMPFVVLTELKNGEWIYGGLLCKIWIAADVVFCGHSVFALFMVNVDRLVFITQPINYRQRMNNGGVFTMVIFTWLLAVGVAVPLFLDMNEFGSIDHLHSNVCTPHFSSLYIFSSGLAQYYVPGAFILVSNVVLIIVAARMKPFIQLKSQAKTNHIGFQQDSRQDARNTVLTMSIVNAVYLFMWLPFFLLTLLIFVKPEFQVTPMLFTVSLYLGYANSGVNPVLWAIDHAVRKGYWRIVWCRYCGRSYEDSYSFSGFSDFSYSKKTVEMTRI